jgi:hypothetical protein
MKEPQPCHLHRSASPQPFTLTAQPRAIHPNPSTSSPLLLQQISPCPLSALGFPLVTLSPTPSIVSNRRDIKCARPHPTPYTLNHEPCTRDPTANTLHPPPYTLPYTLDHLKSKPYTLNKLQKAARDYSQELDGYKGDNPLAHSILHKGVLAKETLSIAVLNPRPSTLNHKLQIANPAP